ncbi:MAG: phosphoenolpyruvate--protein phosphotransferase [Caldisericum sp.]|jgi:phosphotransferase system enzyme I (PtsI)|uniref:phosphoenolpyruvate--protein phosphotransferase n=1 Tax=Caldisericum sp. TaxID=2499687 RepID=UPI003D0D00D4
MKHLKGIPVSKGISLGFAVVYLKRKIEVNNSKDSVPIEEKKKILEKALEKTKEEIQLTYENLKKSNPKEAEIFEAHLLVLEDPTLQEKINKYLESQYNLPYAVKSAFEEFIEALQNLQSEYMKERAQDLYDILDSLLRNILNVPKVDLSNLPPQSIVVAVDLTPSDTASLDRKNVLGFITEKGGPTSHTAILAEALGIPAIVGVEELFESIHDGDELIIDGTNGDVFVNPAEETKKQYTNLKKEKEEEEKLLKEKAKEFAYTKGGKRIEVAANIGSPKDVDKALEMGAEGVGLYRTEFLFLDRDTPPTEEEQFEAYKIVAERFKPHPVIIRTLDIGGDKQIPYLNLEKELNPFLGVRAIRLCLKEKDLFKTQLRAILRASAFGNVLIMYPMIAIKDEIIEANKVLNEVKEDLRRENIPFNENIKVGIMVEIPSAALNAEELVDYVDFFSIGTNDLTQYTYASDRTNENLSYLYRPLDSPILKLIKFTVDASHMKGKWTGVCGELAGDPEAIPILVNLGVDELSMSPSKIPEAKRIIRSI